MKDFNLTEVFCEVLGGGLAIALAIALLDLTGYINVIQLIKKSTSASLGNITVVLIGCYFVGLLVDAVGLTVGELFFDGLVGTEKSPSSDQVRQFWQSADEHVLRYREIQWAFYSAYRTVLLLLIPGTIVFSLEVWKYTNFWLGLTSTVLFVVLEASLFFSTRCLLDLYYSIPKFFERVEERAS